MRLRDFIKTDLPIFFEHQQDPVANHMAAFTTKDPSDWEAFTRHWAKILADGSLTVKTILVRAEVAGYVLCHSWFGEPEISYWIGKDYWGQGVASRALSAFLETLKTRPLSAHVAKDNLGSLQVLKKCGFIIAAEDKGFSNVRGVEVEEFVLQLD